MDESESTPKKYGLPKVRKAASDRLAEAYAQDDLDLEDYEERTEALQGARSVDEIKQIMSDVPDFHVDAIVGHHTRQAARREEHAIPSSSVGAGKPPAAGEDMPPMAVQLLGDRAFDISDLQDGYLRIFTMLGDTEADLIDLGPGETAEITAISILGDLTLRIPVGTEVIRHQFVLLGDVSRKRRKKNRVPKPTEGIPPRVILRGVKLLGDIRIIEY
jgi:hypothetical protein